MSRFPIAKHTIKRIRREVSTPTKTFLLLINSSKTESELIDRPMQVRYFAACNSRKTLKIVQKFVLEIKKKSQILTMRNLNKKNYWQVLRTRE